MAFKDVMLNIATLGAHQRVKNEVERYEELLEDLRILQGKYEVRLPEINKVLTLVMKAKHKAVITVKRTQEILKNVSIRQRELVNVELQREDYSLDRIEASITAHDMAISGTKGTVAGVSTALGAWALVGTYGVASTGTAIGALSGAAATNATLAWLGGGSLAVGGGGIAAGTAVLGGLVAVPVIAITGLFQHLAANKKIARIKSEEIKIIEFIDNIKNNLIQFEAIEMRSNEMIESLSQSLKAYEYIYKRVYKHIYPLGNISKMLKFLKEKIFKKPCYTDKELGFIKELMQATEYILKMTDSPIL
jgi:hypothetical protein